jgi:serine/threonine-protein kinase HipA
MFPPFLEGLLPEGYNLEALLRALKIDRNDHFSFASGKNWAAI